MNVQTRPPMTAAEQKLVDGFFERVEALPGAAAVTARRRTLMGDIAEHGLPTRRIEAWHYTDLRALLRSVPDAQSTGTRSPLRPLVDGALVLPVVDGVARVCDAPDGATLERVAERLEEAGAEMLLAVRGDDDAIGRINGALISDGFDLSIAEEAVAKRPIELQVLHGGGQAHTRFSVSFGRNATATIVERHLSADGGEALTSSITDLDLDEGAEVTWILVQQNGAADTHFGQVNVRLSAGARLTLMVVNAGGKLVREEIHAKAVGAGADLKLRAINLLGGDGHTDVTLTLGHEVPETTSTEIIRNVVFGRARGVFQGQIRVAPDAQKTDARMACNTLLLSDDGEFSTKPELEIFADDVQCAHGATVADIEDSHLFYLMSRGIPQKQARALLVNAFVAEIVEELEDEALVAPLEGVIADWLEAHS